MSEKQTLINAITKISEETRTIFELLLNQRDSLVMILGVKDYTIFTHEATKITTSTTLMVEILKKDNQSTLN